MKHSKNENLYLSRYWMPSSLIRSTSFLGVEMAINFFAGFAVNIILIRQLTTEEFGFYQLALSLAGLSIYFFNFGFSRITLKKVPELLSQESHYAAVRLHLILSLLRACVVVILAFFAYGYRETIANALNISQFSDKFFLLILFYVVLANFHDYFSRCWLASILRRDLVSVGVILRQLTLLFGVVILTISGGALQQLLWVLLGSLMLEFLVLGWQSIGFMHHFILMRKDSPLKMLTLLTFGLRAWVWEVMQFCRDHAAMSLLMSALRGPEYVALQKISRIIPDTIRNLSPAKMGGGIILPKIAYKSSKNEDSDALRFSFILLTKINLLFCAGAIVLLGLNFDVLFPIIFGEKYAGQATVGLLFATSALISILIDPYYIAATATHEGGILVCAGVVGATIMPMAFFLIPLWGVAGAGVSAILSGIALLIFFSRSFSGKGYNYLRFPYKLAINCGLKVAVIPIVFFLLMSIQNIIGIPDYLTIRLLITLFTTAIFLGVIKVYNPFSDKEMAAFSNKIPWLKP